MHAITLRMDTYQGRIVGGGASYLVAKFKTWRDRRHAVAQLNRMNDRLLADIGLDRAQIPQLVDRLIANHWVVANDNEASVAA